MRIAFINQPFDGVLPPDLNSIGLWSYEIARRLAGRHDVRVYAGTGGFRGRRETCHGVEYVFQPVGAGNRARRLIEQLPFLETSGKPCFSRAYFYLDYVFQVARHVRRFRPDVIPRASVVLHMQCEWLTQLHAAMIERRLEHADLIIGCSQFIAESIRAAFPRMADRCHAIYNGVDPAMFCPNGLGSRCNGGEQEVLFVGRGSPEKGIHDLVQAFNAVLARHPNTRLKLIGRMAPGLIDFIAKVCDGDPITADLARRYRSNYKSHLLNSVSPEVAARIEFQDNIQNHQLPESYRRATVFAFPSAWPEPFGIPVVEAMACGIPVVATRSGGIPEIIDHGRTGVLVERANPAGLADAIISLLQNPGLRQQLGDEGCRDVVQRFSWDKIADDLTSLYRSARTSPAKASLA
jgi:glycosyltransferase involved in cell wall biosynthesis